MEHSPKNTESNVESLSDWRGLKDRAEEEAKKLIASIEGLEDMEVSERVDALKRVLEELNNDNENRFVAENIARQISVLLEGERHTARMAELGQVA